MVYDTNAYLTQSQMQVNAQDILDFFIGQGWTKNAICGMLGNMQVESTINYGIWQNLDNTNTANGFGLVQWTPSTNYTNWASSNGYANDDVNGEKQRILYEVANNIQWIATTNYNYSFSAYTKSTDTADNLASAWYYNYERPAPTDTSLPTRQSDALNWFNTLTPSSGGSGGSTTPTKKDDIIHLLLADTLNGWKW